MIKQEVELLSYREEQLLSTEQRVQYYENLRGILMKRKLKVTTPGALTIAPKLKGITGKLTKKFL